MQERCIHCQIEPIRASNVPHNQTVWFTPVGTRSRHYRYHCDACNRVWDTTDVYLLKPIRVRFSWYPPRFTVFLKSYFAGYCDHQKKAWYTILQLGPVRVILGKHKSQWQRMRREVSA